MSLTRISTVTIILLILTFNCGENVDIIKEQETLLQTDIEFSKKSAAEGAAEAFNMYLTDDAILMPSGDVPVFGRENIYQRMKESDGKYELRWDPQNG